MDFGSLLVEQHLPDACLKNLRKLTGPWSCKLKRNAFRLHVAQVFFALAQTLRIELVLCVLARIHTGSFVKHNYSWLPSSMQCSFFFGGGQGGEGGEAWRKFGEAHL